jgi:hypothetical protein
MKWGLSIVGLVLIIAPALAQGGSPTGPLGGGGARWFFSNTNGVSGGVEAGLVDRNLPGFAISDAEGGGNPNPGIDSSGTLWINDLQFAVDTWQITNGVLTTSEVVTAGVNVSVQHLALTDSPTLRSMIVLRNAGGSTVTVNRIDWVFNEVGGVDNQVRATSSGDLTFSNVDRWLVASDSDGTESYGVPVIGYVLQGNGAAETVTQTSRTVYRVFGPSSATVGMRATFESISIPAGATRRLLFFTQLTSTNAEGQSAAIGLETNLGCALFDLSAAARAEVVNWQLPATSLCRHLLPLIRK